VREEERSWTKGRVIRRRRGEGGAKISDKMRSNKEEGR